MGDKPILFSAPMIRALLDGRKTQTRRVLTPQPEQNSAGLWVFPPPGTPVTKRTRRGFCQTDEAGLEIFILSTQHCPYAPGDRLWVRETYQIEPSGHGPVRVFYPADDGEKHVDHSCNQVLIAQANRLWTDPEVYRPSIHMPRWASRLTLIVEAVKVERLRDISEADAIAEGCGLYVPGHGFIQQADLAEGYSNYLNARMGFEAIWTEINGPGAWDANPWVVAVTFRALKQNIDATPTPENPND